MQIFFVFSMTGRCIYKCITDLGNTTGLTVHADTKWLFLHFARY